MNTYPNYTEVNYSVTEKLLIALGLDKALVSHYMKNIAPNLRTVDEARVKIFRMEKDDYTRAVIYGLIIGPIIGCILAIIFVILAFFTIIPAFLFILLLDFTQDGAMILLPIGLLGSIIGSIYLVYRLTLNHYKNKREKAYYDHINKFIISNVVNYFGDDFHLIENDFTEFFKEFKTISDFQIKISPSICFKYDDIPISITEINSVIGCEGEKRNKKWKWQYNILIVAEIKKEFNGITMITQDHGLIGNQIVKAGFSTISRAAMEDPDFEKNYEVYTTDQVEARYLCTTSFIERFNTLNAMTNAKVYAYFYQKKLFLQLIMNQKTHYLLPKVDIEQSQYFIEITNNVVTETRKMIKVIDKLAISR